MHSNKQPYLRTQMNHHTNITPDLSILMFVLCLPLKCWYFVKIQYGKLGSNVLHFKRLPFSTEVGSSLLRHPSPELSRLISAHGSLSKGERNFQWPVLAFVIQHHDLEGLEVAMKHALRKSACRVFAMEVSNIFLRQSI